MSPEEHVARAFHETYQRLAPKYAYETREESACSWEDVPANDKKLMIATVSDLLERGVIDVGEEEVRMVALTHGQVHRLLNGRLTESAQVIEEIVDAFEDAGR